MTKSKDIKGSEVKELKGIIRDLKSKLRRVEKKNKILLGDIKCLQRALDQSVDFIDNDLEGIAVEHVVKSVKYSEDVKLELARSEFRERLRLKIKAENN